MSSGEHTLEEHTLGPTCAYHEGEPESPLPDGSETPPVKAQFFYVSSLPIDDPLSPVPPVTAEKTNKHPPQPFSAYDNAALEEAWQGFQTGHNAKDGGRSMSRPKSRQMFSFPKFKEAFRSQDAPPSPIQPHASATATIKAADIQKEYNKLPAPPDAIIPSKDDSKTSKTTQPTDLSKHVPVPAKIPGVGYESLDPGLEKGTSSLCTTAKESQVLLAQRSQEPGQVSKPVTEQELAHAEPDQSARPPSKSTRRRYQSPFGRHLKSNITAESSPHQASSQDPAESDGKPQQSSSSDISGRPFARAPSKRDIGAPKQDTSIAVLDGADDQSILSDVSQDEQDGSRVRSKHRWTSKNKEIEKENSKIFVPVGVSRLHLVGMPDMMMKPIYWSPINDFSKVTRATWFYKDSVMPVPVAVANALEVGYEDIKPYLDTYQDELQACIDNGASAEMKVVHKLWPEELRRSRPSTGANSHLEADSECPAIIPDKRENTAVDPAPSKEKRVYETQSVIYVDRKNAQILRPNLLPNVRQGRRPLSSVRKGRQIGTAVIRGFDRKEWQKLHLNTKMNETAAHAQVGAYMSQPGDATIRGRRKSCTTCEGQSKAPNVSDLVLVIHGIGQKLSERVDSFHFTHAINDVRRRFNVELSSEAVKGHLKQNTGMMVLPVNWRLTVSFDDDDDKPQTMQDEEHKFDLKNITPDTLPAVRSIISDVMLDIPYYLSHHKEKMTSAVIREANRLYRLWCRNNPGFRENGRVHLVAHSLGSVMAMEILGRQPTRVSSSLRFEHGEPSEKIFEFDTTNLFTCGSPGGFFLLLNNAHLKPRKGRNKPGMEGEDHGSNIAGEESYGCLALDNIYNVLHRNDPISYLVNAAVDADYADSLQPANIPPASAGFWSKMGTSLGLRSSSAVTGYAAEAPSARPQMQSMPSTVEMETHNFTREEIAEKRMYLLNENGQIDYYLPATGGPLEIQYLSMLSAHSSYWLSQDFVRFLVTEIGRKPGKSNTLPALRASKKREWKRGSIA